LKQAVETSLSWHLVSPSNDHTLYVAQAVGNLDEVSKRAAERDLAKFKSFGSVLDVDERVRSLADGRTDGNQDCGGAAGC
jgi:hypothetical protein